MKMNSWKKLQGTLLTALNLVFGLALLICPSLILVGQQDRNLVHQGSTQANGRRRIALVLGNGAYVSAPPLKNPPNDARDMAASLKALGFDVTSGVNLNQREMKRLIREFGQKLKGGGNGLFYYAGHGVQSRGRNYIIPVDAEIQSEADVEDSSVDVGLVLNYMDDAQNGLNIVILDACRNNPFARSFRSASEGLAQVDAPTGTLIAYATAPGRVAADGDDENGIYTSELLKAITVPALSATDMFMQVRAEVMKRTGNKQVPWEASSLVGAFYFTEGASNSSSPNSVAGAGGNSKKEPKFDVAAFEFSYWETIKNSSRPEDFKAYLAKYPEGTFTDLARNRIKSLETEAKPVEPVKTSSVGGGAEVAFWDYIKNSNNAEDFQAYLRKYPNGTFADLANSRLRSLEAVANEKAKEEESKRLAAEAEKVIKTFNLKISEKLGFGLGGTHPGGKLEILVSKFRVDLGFGAGSKEWPCEGEFDKARVDKAQIREIRTGSGTYLRFHFQTVAEATEALGEIKRICKIGP